MKINTKINLAFYVGVSLLLLIGCLVFKKPRPSCQTDNTTTLRQEKVVATFVPEPVRARRVAVILGGVTSIAELRRRINANSVLQTIFKGFDWDKARVFTLDKDREVFMMFRVGDSIFWSKRKVLVRAGTLAITDGQRTLLMRCSNFISYVPTEPSEDIDSQIFEEPEPTPVVLSEVPSWMTPGQPLPNDTPSPTPPTFLPSSTCCATFVPPVFVPPTVPTPETPTILLLFFGGFVILLVKLKIQSKKGR